MSLGGCKANVCPAAAKLLAPTNSKIKDPLKVPATVATGDDVTALFEAKIGFVCTGKAVVMCQQGTLTVSGYTCVDKNMCSPNPCGVGSTCVDKPAPSLGYTCTCSTGYTPKIGTPSITQDQKISCEDTDGCQKITCGIGAQCVDADAPATGYTCRCIPKQFNGADVKNGMATCNLNPRCPQFSGTSICHCQINSASLKADKFTGMLHGVPTGCSASAAGTIDKTLTALTKAATSKSKTWQVVCSGATCTQSDCCNAFVPCPANSGVPGQSGAQGHGSPCPCRTGFMGNIEWDAASMKYKGTCEPIPCPDHPKFPSSTGGMKADGTGTNTCQCPAGYSVKPHCRIEASKVCAAVALAKADSPTKCSASGLCTYIPKQSKKDQSCKLTAKCSGLMTQNSCEAVTDNRGIGTKACNYTPKKSYRCEPVDLAACASKKFKSACESIKIKKADGTDLKLPDGSGFKTVPACTYDTPTQTCKARGSCNPVSIGPNTKFPDGDKALCENWSAFGVHPGDAATAGRICNFIAHVPPRCDPTATCPAKGPCRTDGLDGCDYTPAVPAQPDKCTPSVQRTSKKKCELRPVLGRKWQPAQSASCTGGNPTPLASGVPSTLTACESTNNKWSDASCTSCKSGSCSAAATKACLINDKGCLVGAKSACVAEGGSWRTAGCTDTQKTTKSSCLNTGNTWKPATPSSCSQPASSDNPRNTKDLCENDLTGLLWDDGQCMLMKPSLTDATSCTLENSGFPYQTKVDYAAATCKNKQGSVANVVPLNKANCYGVDTKFVWTPAYCKGDSSFKSKPACELTGFKWRAPVEGLCMNGPVPVARTCKSTNVTINAQCSAATITGPCGAAQTACSTANSGCKFTMEPKSKAECESHDLEPRNHGHGRKWTQGSSAVGMCETPSANGPLRTTSNDATPTNADGSTGARETSCKAANGKWVPGICEGDTGASKAKCIKADWVDAKCKNKQGGVAPITDRNTCVCQGFTWSPERCHGLVFATSKTDCLQTGNKWHAPLLGTCIDVTKTAATCTATWASNWKEGGICTMPFTDKSSCETTPHKWLEDACTKAGSTPITNACFGADHTLKVPTSQPTCEDTGFAWTGAGSLAKCEAIDSTSVTDKNKCDSVTALSNGVACNSHKNNFVQGIPASCTEKAGVSVTADTAACANVKNLADNKACNLVQLSTPGKTGQACQYTPEVVGNAGTSICKYTAAVLPNKCSGGSATSKSPCEKTGNTWKATNSEATCTGLTGNTFTAEVKAAPHNCPGNTKWSATCSSTTCKQSCEKISSGFEWSAVTSIKFDANKGYKGMCTPVICPKPAVANGWVSGEFYYTGSGMQTTCDPGYLPVGDPGAATRAACQASGNTWIEQRCAAYSSGQCATQVPGKCVKTLRTCQSDGHFSNTAVTCQPMDCGSVNVGPNGKAAGIHVYKAGFLKVNCDAGYEVVTVDVNGIETRGLGNEKKFTCPSAGSWSGVPVCRALRCPSYCDTAFCSDSINNRAEPCTSPPCTTGQKSRTPTLLNGWIHRPGELVDIDYATGYNRNKPGDRTYSPTKATGTGWAFTCNNRTVLTPASATTSTCMVNGKWSTLPPKCELITWCPLPSWVGTQDVFDGGTKLGTKVYNIEDCWFPSSKSYARRSPHYLTNNANKVQDVEKWGPSEGIETCKIKCFPTCNDDGKDDAGKPCVDARASEYETWTCLDGGEWASSSGKVCTNQGGRTPDTASCYPACQKAPYSASGASQLFTPNVVATAVAVVAMFI
jgi:hypothetical protein